MAVLAVSYTLPLFASMTALHWYQALNPPSPLASHNLAPRLLAMVLPSSWLHLTLPSLLVLVVHSSVSSSANAINNTRKEIVGFKHLSSDRVVAVEFDTYPNANIGDPEYRHIGIDINSIKSSAVGKWNWQDGGIS